MYDVSEREFETLSHVLMNNRDTGDILTSLDVIAGGGVVLDEGSIWTNDNQVLTAHDCILDSTEPGERRNIEWLRNNRAPCVDELFVISDVWSSGYYHIVNDQVNQLAAYRDFLRSRPDVYVHAGPATLAVKVVRNYLQVFGLRNRVVDHVTRAKVIYKPQNSGCLNPVFAHVQATHELARRYIQELGLAPAAAASAAAVDADVDVTNHSNSSQRRHRRPVGTIVLIKRNTKRGFTNFNDVHSAVQLFGQQTGRQVVLFDDARLPTFNDTMRMFAAADVIIAPHGARLTNMVFSRSGTTVVDIQCKGKTSVWCYRLMALRLGMRYYASETTANHVTRQCNKSFISVDIVELKAVLAFIASKYL